MATRPRNALHDLGYKIFLDRYAQKDMTRATLTVGDTVIVVVNSATGQREVGHITALDLPQVTIQLLDGEVVTRDVEHVDKPLETDPGQMMDRVARGIAEVETTPEAQRAWAERFRWLLDDWKFVPGGRILTAAGTDQNLTFYNCMPPDQPVLTATGYRPIADIRVGDLVVTHHNRLRHVTHIFQRETQEDLYILKPRKVGYDDLRLTGEHKVYAIRAGWVNKHKSRDGLRLKQQPTWTPARELQPGDYVAIAHNGEICPPNVIMLQDYLDDYQEADGRLFRPALRGDGGRLTAGGTQRSPYAQIHLDADTCEFFGRWLGDGCITHRTDTEIPSGIKIVFGLDEEAAAKHFVHVAERVLGVPAALKLSSTGRWYDLWVNSLPVGTFFKAFFGAYSYGKRLPQELTTLPDDLTIALLRGLFQADGYVGKMHMGMLLANKTLITQVHQLLLRLGYLFSVKENTHRLARHRSYRLSAALSACGPLLELLFDKPADSPSRMTDHFLRVNDLFWVRLDAIEVQPYTGTVMDLEVSEDHSFVSAGVVVSNCYVVDSPRDSREGIIHTLREMTEIMSRGGGVGINLSSLRPRHAYVKGVNGRSSGSVSWGALYSFVTGLIEQGGCFAGTERIATDKGLIPSAELADRMDAGEVFHAHTHKGLKRIVHRFRNGVKPVFEVITGRGYSVRVTEDHKIAVLADGQVVTTPLKYLQPGDEVLLLLGGDDDVSTVHTGTDLSAMHSLGSRLAAETAPDACVPDEVFTAGYVAQRAFLFGYLSGGDLAMGPWASASKRLLHGVQQLLARHGVAATLEGAPNSSEYVLKTLEPRSLSLSAQGMALAQHGGSSMSPAYLADVAVASSPSWTLPDTIVSITPVGETDTFDFEVEDVHLLSGGGIYTSNSRRGALMLILNDWHPDVFDFINSKRKAGNITNANISVGISDPFMDAVKADADWDLVFPDTSDPSYNTAWNGDIDAWRAAGGKVVHHRTVKARALWDALIESAWASAEPGLWFRDRANKLGNSTYFNPMIATNPCLTGDMRLHTDKGLVRLDELFRTQEDFEVTLDGRFGDPRVTRPSTRVFATGVKPVLRLETEEGYSLRATADHRVMTERGWVEMGNLLPGDQVHILNRKGAFGTEGTETLGRVLGWVVGDGTIKADKVVLSFFGDEKRALAPLFAGYIDALVAPLTDATRGVRTYPVGVVEVKGRDEARVASARLLKIMAEHGLTENKLQVPEAVFRGTEATQRGFLQALFTADGSVQQTTSKATVVRLASSHLPLLQQVQVLLSNFGIASRIFRNRRPEMQRLLPDGKGGKKLYTTKAQHELHIAKMNVVVFAREVGFLLDRKTQSLAKRLGDYPTQPRAERFVACVREVMPDGVETVYDVTAPPHHAVVVNGISSSQCGEQPLGAYSVCNLGALHMGRFYDPHAHDVAWDDLGQAVRYGVRFLDNVIDATPYFFPENERVQLGERRVGLGTMGIAELLIHLGIRYGSPESVAFIDKLYHFIAREAYLASSDIAAEKGAFPRFEAEPFLQSGYMQAMDADVREAVARKGIRNVTLLTQAPTGTTGTMVNTSTGIEPFFSWVYYRKSRLGLHEEQVPLVADYYAANPGAETLPDYFVTAMDLTPEEHVRAQAAFQRWVDSAISKTANLPNNYTVAQVSDLYMLMYDLGCKGGTVYRDGSRDEQVLMLKPDEAPAPPALEAPASQAPAPAALPASAPVTVAAQATPHRVYPRPDKLTGVTVRCDTPFGTAYITMNSDQHGQPFEVFITAPGKGGSDLQADAEGLGRLISLALRTTDAHNRVSMLRLVIGQLRDIGGSRSSGFGVNRVTSLPDAVARALEEHYFPQDRHDQLGLPLLPELQQAAPPLQLSAPATQDVPHTNGNGHAKLPHADMCPQCTNVTLVRAEGCRKCLSCGYSEC